MSSVKLSSCCSCYVFSQQFPYFLLVKRVKCSAVFLLTTKTIQPPTQVFSVNSSMILTIDVNSSISQNSSKFGHLNSLMDSYFEQQPRWTHRTENAATQAMLGTTFAFFIRELKLCRMVKLLQELDVIETKVKSFFGKAQLLQEIQHLEMYLCF